MKGPPPEPRPSHDLSKHAKGNKYHAVKTTVDGIEFDSKKESEHYKILKLMEQAGIISNLQRQVKYPIVVNGIKICYYRSDFTFIRDGKLVVQDVKSKQTVVNSTYRLKCKLVRAVHGIAIEEVLELPELRGGST